MTASMPQILLDILKRTSPQANKVAMNIEALIKTKAARKQKAISTARQSIKKIEGILPKSSKIAKSLADLILKAATEKALPLQISYIFQRRDDRLQVVFATPQNPIPFPPPDHIARKSAQSTLDDLWGKNTSWKKRPGQHLIYATTKPVPASDTVAEEGKDTSSADFRKYRAQSLKTAKHAQANAPISHQDAKALFTLVSKLANIGYPFDVVTFTANTTTGAMRCYLSLLHPKKPSKEAINAALKALKSCLLSNRWQLDTERYALSSSTGQVTFSIKSPPYPHLVGAKPVSQTFRTRYGLTKKPTYHAALYHLGAIESRLSKEPLNLKSEAELFSSVRSLASRDNNQFYSALTSGLSAMFDRELNEMSAVFGNIARVLVKDSQVREWYAKQVSAIPDTIRSQVKAGKISLERGAQLASILRNEVMEEARKKGTQWGKAYATRIKANGRKFTELIDKNVKKLGATSIADLTPEQRNLIHTEIIDSAGRPNPKEVKLAKIAGKVGQRLWILTFVLAGWAVFEAEDPLQEAFRQSVGLGTGFVGGIVIASLACGPGAFVCASAATFIGGALVSFGAFELYDRVLE